MFERLKSLLGINKKEKIVVKHHPVAKSTKSNSISTTRKHSDENDDIINQTANTIVVNTMTHNLLYDATTPSKTLINDSFENKINEESVITPTNDDMSTKTTTVIYSNHQCLDTTIDTEFNCNDSGSISYDSPSFGD